LELVYQVADSQVVLRAHKALLGRGRTALVSRNVLLLGLTSLFTDISSEMVTTILPLYLLYGLGLSPLAFGVLDGLQQGSSALVRVAAGFAADRLRRYKEIAAIGYGVSAVAKLGMLAAGSSLGAIGGVVFADRIGKGIRTGPRDALISLSTPSDELGTAFGVHRTLDTAGALIGPLVAFGLLALAPRAYDTVFVVSFAFALIGFGILTTFVESRKAAAEEPKEQPSLRAAAGLLRDRRLRLLIVVGAGLAVATMSDGFVYLGLQRRMDFDLRLLPLLFVGTAFTYMLLATPVGRLADRVGRARVFIGGYVLLLGVYAGLLLPTIGLPALLVVLLLFGAYYAATDGVLMALASTLLPEELRASGLSLVVSVTSVARLVASIAFGAVWAAAGIRAAIIVFGIALVTTTTLAAVLLLRRWTTADA
jgi:MFS family permease